MAHWQRALNHLRPVPLQMLLVGSLVPLVAGTGLIVSTFMAQRMQALALESATAGLQAEVGEIRQRWQRRMDPKEHLRKVRKALDEYLSTNGEEDAKANMKLLARVTEIFKTSPALSNINILRPDEHFIRFHNPLFVKNIIPEENVALIIEESKSKQEPAIFTLIDQNLRITNKPNASLTPLSQTLDPRSRPSIAKTKATRIEAVLTNDNQHPLLGPLLTLGKTTLTGDVIEVESPISEIERIFNEFKPTESTRLSMVDLNGTVWADSAGLTGQQDDKAAANGTSSIQNGIRKYIEQYLKTRTSDIRQQKIEVKEGKLTSRNWLFAIAELPGVGMKEKGALMVLALPSNEVFAAPLATVRQAQWITLAMVMTTLPLIWLLTQSVTRPIRRLSRQANAIRRFNFEHELLSPSLITEVNELDIALAQMRQTIQQFLKTTTALASEQDLEILLTLVVQSAVTNSLAAGALLTWSSGKETTSDEQRTLQYPEGFEPQQLHSNIHVPLLSRDGTTKGQLELFFKQKPQEEQIAFCQALAGSATVALETASLIQVQKELFDSLITMVAGAIDAKSPYTGKHCSRVPILTQWLAEVACSSNHGVFASFQLSSNEWEALRLAAWLHDCGKITTPEHVVDKATKLETIYNRIHEVRMRFELIKKEAETQFWKQCFQGGSKEDLLPKLQNTHRILDEEFAFIANCNLGGEAMQQKELDRIQTIAQRTWIRTLDDRLGLSMEERKRGAAEAPASLPCEEPLLADKTIHRFARPEQSMQDSEKFSRFNLVIPELIENNGELHNLSIQRGTLNEEERSRINLHIVETILILESMNFPAHLADVPAIAGAHHERVDGAGYPLGLKVDEMPAQARMMAIADVFEALTASDRPYKAAKPLSVAMNIMVGMVNDHHLDADLFRLFVEQGIHRRYANQFLQSDQIDALDDEALLAAINVPINPHR